MACWQVRLVKFNAALLVVDIDGTLVGQDGMVSAADRAALFRVRDAGVAVSLCTGRAVNSCSAIFRELSLNGYHTFFDGALVTDPGHRTEIYAKYLDPAVVAAATVFARSQGIHFELYSVEDCFIEAETRFSAMRREYFGLEPVVGNFDELWHRKPIIKGGFVAASPQDIEQAQCFQLEFRECLSFTKARNPAFPDLTFVNVIAPGVSKGEALAALARYLGVRLERVMAIGDGENDVPLFKHAGLSVAMAGASPEAKAAADYVTLDLAQSGVSAAINHFLF